jgi:lipocalin
MLKSAYQVTELYISSKQDKEYEWIYGRQAQWQKSKQEELEFLFKILVFNNIFCFEYSVLQSSITL